MTEILTESFCERCGTRYTFESSAPRRSRLGRVRTFSKGVRNFVMSDDASFSEAMADARSELEMSATAHQLDAFHQTFNFCLTCRQYTCGNCWNQTEGRCLTCAPVPGLEEPSMSTAATIEPSLDGNGHAPADMDGAWPEADLARIAQVLGEPAASTTFETFDTFDDSTDHDGARDVMPADAQEVGAPPPVGATDHLVDLPASLGPAEDLSPAGEAAFSDEVARSVSAPLPGVAPGQSIEDAIAAYESQLAADEAASPVAADELQLAADEAASPVAADELQLAADEAASPVAADESQLAADEAATPDAGQAWTSDAGQAWTSDAGQAWTSDAGQAWTLEEEQAWTRPDPAPSGSPEVASPAAAAGMFEAAVPTNAPFEPQAAIAAQATPLPPEPPFRPEPPAAQVAFETAPASAGAPPPPPPLPAIPPAESPVGMPPSAPVEAWPVEAAVDAAPVEAAPPPPMPPAPPAAPAGPETLPPAAPPADVIVQPTWPVPPPSELPPAPANTPAEPAVAPWLMVAPDDTVTQADPQWPQGPAWPEVSNRAYPRTLAGRPLLPRDDASALWAASAREVLGAAPANHPAAVPTPSAQPCVQCGLSLSANARFCRRCGSRQG